MPADYDLAIFSSNGTTRLARSQVNGTANESITRTYTAGTYYARVYGSNGANNATNCYTLRVETGTASRNGGDQLITVTNDKLSVFPNPAGYNATLTFNALAEGKAAISVINQAGNVVLQRTIAVNEGPNNNKLDVANLANGIYTVKIQIGGVLQMAKLVVIK